MKSIVTATLFPILLIAASALSALEVRFQPADTLFVYENRGEGTPANLYTAVLQNVAFVHLGDQPITLQRAWIEAYSGDQPVHRDLVPEADLVASAQKYSAYQQQGVLDAYDFHFQTTRYLAGVSLSPDLSLEDRQAVVISGWALLFHGVPDRLVVVGEAVDSEGRLVRGESSLAVVLPESKNKYLLPVEGRWVAAAAPSLHSHHRWASIQEFAIDLVQFGDDGLTHAGDGTELEQYLAFGQPVLSVGNGTVVVAQDGMAESNDNLRRSTETAADYQQRVMIDQQKRLAAGFATALGNHVVIEHADGEFSHYAHLRNGSVLVKPGDRVAAGQQIAELGHSGNSTEPHLHFHLADGADVAYSRSIPIVFDNITLWPADDGSVRHLHSGQVIETR